MRHQEEPFIINNETPIYEAVKETPPVFSCLGVPITLKKRLLGFIIIAHEEKNYFSAQHTILLSSLASHISVSIENNLLYNKIRETANLDGLTGIFNKRYFFDTLSTYKDIDTQNYTIAMIDIDRFKKVNDTYGHLFGDIVLKKVIQIIKDNIRPIDIAARYGGEEIIIFFKDFTNPTSVETCLESIRYTIEQTPIIDDDIVTSVTASLGAYIKYNEVLTLKEAINRADSNLYICKDLGRNRIHFNKIN
ncbi:GGDEF domain-containing protein [Cellulosilyticum ruminicola]|uniref:GGDEF domain-containing protein n=1 Tax=Cellulosilyticum ruminicola TaxID=425254 RepID=UPI0006D0DDA7|nr:sensor domain-containing diguanylate cyclase [Cellulosilyticum ruminicola]